MTKYNPDYHSNVVRNCRQSFKTKHDRDSTLTDEQVWKIFDGILAPTSEEQDEWVVETMIEQEN